MEEFPPPYEVATARDAWALVAPYISSGDLCSAALVCRTWHRRFVPFLWGAPASHFGEDRSEMYIALNVFRRMLPDTRLWVRRLTHTLHLPPVLTEIYGGPRSTWLVEMLQYLPNLQCLLVSHLPFLYHNALTALKWAQLPLARGDSEEEGERSGYYTLRLLLAQHEPNTTAVGIAETLSRFPKLVYLDLSYTTPARDKDVISVLPRLPDLQVLKLRGVGLRDGDAEALATAVGTRPHLLDLRNNSLTDAAVRALLQGCFLPREAVTTADGGGDALAWGTQPRSHYEWSLSETNILTADSLRSEHLDEHLLRQLGKPLTGRAAPEDLPHAGVTHLYLADNHISVEALASLLETTRLHVLDGGTVETQESIRRRQHRRQHHQASAAVGNAGPDDGKGMRDKSEFITTVRFPGAEKLVPVLAGPAARNLTYLRVHHAVVTEDVSSATAEEGLSMESLGRELPTGRAEDSRQQISGGKKAEMQGIGSSQGDGDNRQSTISPAEFTSSSHPLSGKIQELLAKRPKRSTPTSRTDGGPNMPYLHPSHLPHLRTLVLTDVPSSVSSSSPILTSLVRLLTACADESLLASLSARTNYSLPPGMARPAAERQLAKSLFSLERIVLEITPVRHRSVRRGPSAWMPQGYYNPGVAKSSTEDTDSENLWAAAVNDFSFFGDEECGVPDDEETGKGSTTSRHQQQQQQQQQGQQLRSETPAPEVDLVKAVADFRRARRFEYDALVSSSSSSCANRTAAGGGVPPHVEGHWKGEVKVVRNPTPTEGRGGVAMDSDGNYFEMGYLYS